MGFKIANKSYYLNDGIPYVWGTGDETTAPSNEVKIKPSDGASSDYFGRAIAVDCGRIVVGAHLDDDNGTDSGSAYIFDLNGNQLAKIKASDGAADDRFGRSVAVGSGRIVVGSFFDDDNGTDSGSAYIFDLNGTQLAKIKASDGAAGDQFGQFLAVGSGRIVVGAFQDDDGGTSSGSAYIFDLDGTQLAKITASDAGFADGFGAGVSAGNGRIVVGAYNRLGGGGIYIFDLAGNQLAQVFSSDKANDDYFGWSVAVGCGRIVASSWGDDDNGSNSGSAYIFDLNGTQLAKIKAPDGAADDRFGYSVDVGSGRIVVGAWKDDDNGADSGSSYIFDLEGNYITKIKASDGGASDFYGDSVAVGSGRIVVGAYGDDDNGAESGSAYIYTTPEMFTIYDAIEYQKGYL